jgi:hypothetical protein
MAFALRRLAEFACGVIIEPSLSTLMFSGRFRSGYQATWIRRVTCPLLSQYVFLLAI